MLSRGLVRVRAGVRIKVKVRVKVRVRVRIRVRVSVSVRVSVRARLRLRVAVRGLHGVLEEEELALVDVLAEFRALPPLAAALPPPNNVDHVGQRCGV